jgi:pimeloyl-ACP methyl ester carboxylesterase
LELLIGTDLVQYSVRGSGPPLLVPLCNVPVLEMPYVDALSARLTVIGASPRGYEGSSRMRDDEPYTGEMLASDLLAVCDRLGFERFAVFGYSLTAAMGAWLASRSPRVEAVIAGGFPLMGAYERVLAGAEREAASLADDPRRAAELDRDFDVRAVLSFYRMLATRPEGALVTDVPCPMFAFWGADDDVLWSFNAVPDLAESLTDRGVATRELMGRDHVGAILGFGDIIDHVIEWLIAHGDTSTGS